MTEDKKRINVYIPTQLYVKATQPGESLTDAITHSLELYFKNNSLDLENKPDEYIRETGVGADTLQELRIKELQTNHQERIQDFKEQIDKLHETHTNQVNILADQLKIKDTQIEKLNETLQNQVLNIHSLVQENTKLLPENKERKRWWEFWRN